LFVFIWKMKCIWVIAAVLAMYVAVGHAAPAKECPEGFKKQQSVCSVERPANGKCPTQSYYDVYRKMCVWVRPGSVAKPSSTAASPASTSAVKGGNAANLQKQVPVGA
jgi:hypothetical protein